MEKHHPHDERDICTRSPRLSDRSPTLLGRYSFGYAENNCMAPYELIPTMPQNRYFTLIALMYARPCLCLFVSHDSSQNRCQWCVTDIDFPPELH